MSIDTKIRFVPLSFINTHQELKRQVINTTIWSYYAKIGALDLLGNLLDSTQYGYTASACDFGTHKMLRITDILNGSVNWEQVPYCDCNKSKEYLLQSGDILVARTGGTTGKSFLVNDVPDNAVFASYLIRLRAKNKKFEQIIYSMMNSYLFWSQITELKSGSAQPNVNAEKLKKIVIPKIKEENISEVLEVLNGNLSTNKELRRKICEVENKLNQLEEIGFEFSHQEAIITKLQKSILQDAIQGKLVPQDPNDEPATTFIKKRRAEKEDLIKDGKLKKEKPLPPITIEEMPFELPEGWTWCRLGEITKSVEYGTSEKANLDSSNIPILRMNNIVNGELNKDDLKFVKLTIKDLPRLFLNDGDVLFNRTNSFELVGKSAVYRGGSGKFTFASYLIRLCLFDNVSSEYINHYINSTICRTTQLEPYIIQQNGQANFNGTKLKNILVPLPPAAEQVRIKARIVQLFDKLRSIKEEIVSNRQKAELLMQTVLQEAFN